MRHSLDPNSSHPIAEQTEALIRSGKADEARAILEPAIESEPYHPDLYAALGLLYAFSGEEDEAVQLLGKAGHGPRARRLGKILTEHLICRQQMSAKTGKRDGVAHVFLSKVRLTGDRPLDSVGISVSACLIVKNESKNLARCLNSLKQVVDEIVVVDTGSTDDTVEIAKSFGATIGHFDWCDDFSAARNHSLELATGHWALWIDADEELTPESAAAIERAVVRPHFGGFAIEIVNYTDDRSEAAQYVHTPVRLFRHEPSIRFTNRIHEQIVPSFSELGLPWAYLKGARLMHYGYRPTEMEERGKIQRTISLVERELEEDPTNAFQWFNLANAYTAANDFPNAEKAAAMCAKHLEGRDQMGPLNYQLWSNALLKQDRAAEAAKVCNEADRLGFGGLLNDFERANAYLRLGLADEGLEAANRCLAAEWPSDMTGDMSIAEYKRYIVRGQLLAMLNQYDEALAMFDKALAVDPGYGPAIYSRATTLESKGDLDVALQVFLSGQTNPAVGHLCLKGAGRVSTSLGKTKESIGLFREAWRLAPNDKEAWLGWIEAAEALAEPEGIIEAYTAFTEWHEPNADLLINLGRAYHATGELDRALDSFKRAMEKDPANANAYFNCGDLLYKLQAFDQAAELYQAGLKLDMNNANGWFVLGNSLAQLGILQAAEVSYRQALALKPDYREARQNLETIAEAA